MMKSMRIFSIITVLCLLFCGSALAAQPLLLPEHDMTIQLPENFTVITPDNVARMETLLSAYDTTVTETSLKMKNQNYLFLGLSSTMRCTLFLSCTEDEVSHTIGDLITYDDRVTAETLLLGSSHDGVTVKEIEQRGALFYRVDFGVQNTAGRIAYITVMNGKSYTLCVVDNTGKASSNTNALIDTVFANWDYNIDAEQSKIATFKQNIRSTLYWICLPVGLLLILLLIRWIMRDIRKSHMDADRQRNLPKRPRR